MTTEIDAEGLAAAREAFIRKGGYSFQPEAMSAAITAYLSASRSTSEAEPHAGPETLKHRYERVQGEAEPVAQCCMCGKTGLSTVEGDGGTECQLSDGRWTCSQDCWERAVDPTPASDDQVEAVDWQRAAMDETVRQISSMLTWGDVPLSRGDVALVDHIKGMPERMTPDFSPAKIGRWLGWAQGVACAKGWLHLDDCKRINKTASDALAAMGSTKPAPRLDATVRSGEEG